MKRLQLLGLLFTIGVIQAAAVPRAEVFIRNSGQWPASVLYGAMVPNGMVWITPTGLTVDVRTPGTDGVAISSPVTYTVIGSRGSASVIEKQNPQGPTVSVFGNGMNGRLHTAESVTITNVLPGISIEYVWDAGTIRYNIHAQAGITPPVPFFSVTGSGTLGVHGTVTTTHTPNGSVAMQGVASFHSGHNTLLPTTTKVNGNTFGYSVSGRSPAKALTIDPLVIITGIAGNATEQVTGSARMPDGSLAIAGWTTSTSFSGLPQGVTADRSNAAAEDGFIAILSPDLRTLTHIAFLVGDKSDKINDIAIRKDGSIYVTGATTSQTFPLAGTPVGQLRGKDVDGFIAGFSADLSQQKLGMYLPGNGNDVATGITVSSMGHIVVVGTTTSTQGLTAAKVLVDSNSGGTDGFVYVLNSSLLYSEWFTYVGGTADDSFSKVALGRFDGIYACGTTKSANLPTYPRKQLIWQGEYDDNGEEIWVEVGRDCFGPVAIGGNSDVMVAKFNFSGLMEYLGYYGSPGADEGVSLYADSEVGVYIVGTSDSPGLPQQSPKHPYTGKIDVFVAVISADGFRVSGSAYLGGSNNDYPTACARVNGAIGAVVGYTESNNLEPFGPGAVVPSGKPGGFAAILSTSETSFITGINDIQGLTVPTGVSVDGYGDITIAGNLLPRSPGTDPSNIFAAKWAFGVLNYVSPDGNDVVCAGNPITVKWITESLDPTLPMEVSMSTDAGLTWSVIGSEVIGTSFTYKVPDNLPASALCKFRVRSARGHSVETVESLPYQQPARIVSQPQSSYPCPGAKVLLQTESLGDNVQYQWRKNKQPIIGATGATYVIPTMEAQNSGTYDVLVINGCSSLTSDPAVVEMLDKPVIDAQPKSATVTEGQPFELSVMARGSNLTYQWYKDGQPQANLTEPVIIISESTPEQSGSYTCTITSDCGEVTTDAAVIVIEKKVIDHVAEAWPAGSVLTVRPMPVGNAGVAEVPALAQAARLSVYTLQGTCLLQIPVPAAGTPQLIHIPVASLPAGSYTLVLTGMSQTLTTPLIVIR